MKKSRFSDEQIVKILSSVTDGVTVREVCHNHRVSDNTLVCPQFWYHQRPHASQTSTDL